MDVLCSDKTGTLTLNKLTVDNNLIEVCKSWEWNIAHCIWSAKLFSCKFMFQVKHSTEAGCSLHPHHQK
jgi:magnesium-transporting ATPase (P-type)